MKIKFPVAKIREDGTPAVWLTHSHWLLIRGGIVMAYRQARQGIGQVKARNDARRRLKDDGLSISSNARLKDWEFLDSWPGDISNAEAALELYRVGYAAWNRVSTGSDLAPETLSEYGDKWELSAYSEEQKQIETMDTRRSAVLTEK